MPVLKKAPPTHTAHPQKLFLAALKTEVPQVLEDLRDTIFPIYRGLPATAKSRSTLRTLQQMRNSRGFVLRGEEPDLEEIPLPDILISAGLDSLGAVYPSVAAFRAALTAWADRWHVNEVWILDAALSTLYRWEQRSDTLEAREWASQYTTPEVYTTSDEARFTFMHGGWVPEMEPWSTYQESVQVRFKEALKQYEKKMKELPSVRRLTARVEVRNPDHFAFLARY